MIGRLKACSGVGAEKLTATITLAELEACLALCKDNKAVGLHISYFFVVVSL